MIRSRTSFHVLRQVSCLVSYRLATRAGLVHGLSWTGLATPITPWLRATVHTLMLEVVLAERKLITYVHAVVDVIDDETICPFESVEVLSRRGREDQMGVVPLMEGFFELSDGDVKKMKTKF
ncbi:hypothetical protein TIFTF001_029966 [Ficus carica]|uniref:Uncharacterized protein n=1 Tax=Ficus carica TaxID=3494 RepID=A0AA88J338_FICCA|nr:hypothetical protein TIFTF001_029966 [Ficus carica]